MPPACPWFERRFQILALQVTVSTNCPAMNRELDYLVQDARQDYSPTATVRYELIRAEDEFRLLEDGQEWRRAGDPFTCLTHLYRRVYGKSNEALPPATVFLHAACGSLGGRRFILMGESGVGKTTLITRLVREGALVEGDELVALTPRGFAAVPRRYFCASLSIAIHEMPTKLGITSMCVHPCSHACPHVYWTIVWHSG